MAHLDSSAVMARARRRRLRIVPQLSVARVYGGYVTTPTYSESEPIAMMSDVNLIIVTAFTPKVHALFTVNLNNNVTVQTTLVPA